MAQESGGRRSGRRRLPALTRDAVIRRINSRREEHKPSPLVVLKDVFEEAPDTSRFVGDTMFWKYFEDIDIGRIYHPTSVEFQNLKVMFRETIFYVLVLLILSIYGYTLQSRECFDARQQQLDYWSGCGPESCSVEQVDGTAAFWHWMKSDLVRLAYTQDGPAPEVAQLSSNFPGNGFPVLQGPRFVGPGSTNVLLGTVRLRQLRVEPNQGCEVSRLAGHALPDCYGAYSPSTESTRTYAPRFAPTYLRSAYAWRSEMQTRQAPVVGAAATYAGDGFMLDLPANGSEASAVLADLYRWHWVDRATRAVVIELSTLNTNVNILTNTQIVFEFTPTGAVLGSAKTRAAQVFLFVLTAKAGPAFSVLLLQILLLILFVCYTGFTLWLMYKTCQNFLGDRPIDRMRRSGCGKSIAFIVHTLYHYFRFGWNAVDMGILFLFYCHLWYRLDAYVTTSSEEALAPDVIGHPEVFMPLSKIMLTLVYSNNALAVLVMVSWIKLFKYLCMSIYFRLLVRILERCAVRLFLFFVLLLMVFVGFSTAFFMGLGDSEETFSTAWGSFLVLFFLLLDGYSLDQQWFDPGRNQLMPVIYFCFIAVRYFVLLNIFLAVVLDIYATSSLSAVRPKAPENPMLVFLHTYWNWMKGVSLAKHQMDPDVKKEDLDIRLELLPGIVRRKWIEKKRKMQQVASENFEGMELFPGEGDATPGAAVTITDWMLPTTQMDVMERMGSADEKGPLAVYEVPSKALHGSVSKEQLQRLMDEDSTLPLLLGSKRAVDVIRRFRSGAAEVPEDDDEGSVGENDPTPLKALQAHVFGRVDELEKVKLDDEEPPDVPAINELTEAMSGAVTDVRNQFRMELAGIIEATGSLFEHLVELTQGVNAVRGHHQEIVNLVRRRRANMDAGMALENNSSR